mgnify:CR=1 FL=1|jgi:hypothetical protein
MARIDYAISVTPIQAGTFDVTHTPSEAGSDQDDTAVDYIDPEIGRTLGGGNSSATWAGSDIDAWAGGNMTHIEANTSGAAVGASGDNGIWIKHTGKAYDSSKTNNIDTATPNTEAVTVKLVEVSLCTLQSGECIFLPAVLGVINVFGADDTGPAIEYAKLT